MDGASGTIATCRVTATWRRAIGFDQRTLHGGTYHLSLCDRLGSGDPHCGGWPHSRAISDHRRRDGHVAPARLYYVVHFGRNGRSGSLEDPPTHVPPTPLGAHVRSHPHSA